MEQVEKLAWFHKVRRFLFLVTWVLYVPPLAIYSVARMNGTLPSEAEWAKQGGNHGPWWGEDLGFLILLGTLVMASLPCFTFLFTIAECCETEKGRALLALARGTALASFQLLVGFGVFWIVFWTID